jgi:signal transduction histidine kinase
VLTIEDFGKGMPEIGAGHAASDASPGSSPMQGVGLASMRERLHQIGGWLEISSRVGRTTLKAVVPALDQHRP